MTVCTAYPAVPKSPSDIAKLAGKPGTGALVIVTAKPSSLAAFETALDLFYVNRG